jgi:hypothetical protein
MKRSVLLGVSVIALMTISDQPLAAGAETPAPSERAAPAARRAAPQRARPAPTPQRQAAQSQSSSFTGTQAGGFGGGNAGGGGFADPSFCGTIAGGFNPACGSATQNIGKNTGALGGLELGQMFPAGYWLWGWAVDAQGSTLRSEGNQNGVRLPFGGAAINEGFSTSQTQPFMTTARLKLGGIVAPGTALYVTGGASGVYVHGDFNYQAYNVLNPTIAASGANSYDKFRLGYALGGGVTFSIPGSPVGFTIEYLYTDEGTVNQAIPVTCNGTAGACATPFATGLATTSMKTQASAIRAKFSQGF